ncbi:hypothetical protein DM01DRAFT_1283380, partial [Hesseltinella vesiculosa]
GEVASYSTRKTREFNNAVFGNNDERSVGRKIDILMKQGSHDPRALELCSIEMKKSGIGPASVVEQQCKNLRTNATILNNLQSLDPRHKAPYIVGLDWIGSTGNLFALVDLDGIFFAKTIGILHLPKALTDFKCTKDALELIFCFKAFITKIGQSAQSAIEYREELDQFCETIDTSKETSPYPTQHNVFITPTKH